MFVCVFVFDAGDAVWNLHVRQDFMLSGDESGRIVLWAIEQQQDQHDHHHASSPAPSPTHHHRTASGAEHQLGGAHASRPLLLTKLACWPSAMAGSFQCCCLDQVNGHAYVCFTDSSCRFSELWRVSRRGGGRGGGGGGLAQIEAPSPPSCSESPAPSKSKRNRRVSMEMDLEAKATVTHSSLEKDAQFQVPSLQNLHLASSSEPLQQQQEPSQVGAEEKLDQVASYSPSTARSTRAGGAFASTSTSRRSSHAAPTVVFPSLHTSSLSFDTIATIQHEGVEPSCMRCRVGSASVAAQGRALRSKSKKSGSGGGDQDQEQEGARSSKGAETCVYLGLMDGSVQKHILGEIF